jgi:hypothetical protein
MALTPLMQKKTHAIPERYNAHPFIYKPRLQRPGITNISG